MEAVGLPFFGPSIEFGTVPSIEPKRLLTFFNQFVANSVLLLNRFAIVCQDRLADLDVRLQDVESTLAILEAKLASIPCDGDTTVEPALDQQRHQQHEEEAASTAVTALPDLPSLTAELQTSEAEESAPSITDPAMAKFFKMLQVGVPLAAVEQKMRAEGFDPSLLKGSQQ